MSAIDTTQSNNPTGQSRKWYHALRNRLAYVASLPERTVRSFAAVAGGTTTLLTDTLFPNALRGTTIYKVFVGDTQRFVIEKIAQIEQQAANLKEASDPAYIRRKMIGGALETAGLFAMHVSPLWVFALLGDAASGGNVFFQRLVDQLKANNVIDANTNVDNITDVLEAMQDATSGSATAIDTPPLSREELSRLVDDMRSRYTTVFKSTTDLMPKLDTLWQQMNDIAATENVSVERVMGVLTIDVGSVAKRGVGAAKAVGQTGFALVDEHILDDYARTLRGMREQGLTGFVDTRLQPFVQSAMSHFDPNRKTWTESIFGVTEEEAPIKQPPALPAAIDPIIDEASQAKGDTA